MSNRKTIAIIGVGLIGGSMAIRLHEKKLSSKIIGVDANPHHAKQALDLELVDEIVDLDTALAIADVILIAIPVNNMVTLLPKVLDKISNQQIVFDIGSTKKELIASVKNHPKRKRYIASHPMWGTEYSGPAAAQKNAFEGKAVIICDRKDSDKDVIDWVENMYLKIGMRIVDMNAFSHDLHVAYISHISHITSFALANTVLEKEKAEEAIFEIASAGFESTVRLAKSNPDMWVPILLQNKENVVDVLNEHIDQLTKFRDSIQSANQEQLTALITQANKIKKIIQ